MRKKIIKNFVECNQDKVLKIAMFNKMQTIILKIKIKIKIKNDLLLKKILLIQKIIQLCLTQAINNDAIY